MSTPFTPGPWFVDEHGVSSEAVLGIARVYHAATCESWSGSDLATMEHCKANACLMASAPDLLAALKATYEALLVSYPLYTSEMDMRGSILGQARAAIAKATGSNQ